jgi:membrane-associated phospholipid phosphatase
VWSRPIPWRLVWLAVIALAVFGALTIAVTSNPSLSLDARAFSLVHDLRAPWLDAAARTITTLGLLVIVGPAVVLAAVPLIVRGHRARGAALLAGAALAWLTVWIVKALVDRPRPTGSLVHTSGQSYPSGHAANSVGWLALAVALTVTIPTDRGRIAAISFGALLAALVGLSRIYLRAHYASDVLAGEALAVAMYALAAVAARWTAGAAPRRGVKIALPEREAM